MVSERLKRALPSIARRFQNLLKTVCPVDTGRLKNSIKVKVIGKGLRISLVEYGREVEFGTPPHVITPKKAKALKFKSGGKTIFTKVVHHPGTRPNPFIRNSIRNELPKIIREELG